MAGSSALVNLTYNRKSGHVKRDGAIIGRIDWTGDAWVWSPFVWDRNAQALTAPSLDLLLAKIRQALVRQHSN